MTLLEILSLIFGILVSVSIITGSIAAWVVSAVRSSTATHEFDSYHDDATIALPFDPAPCNGLMVDRVDRVGRVIGCG